MTAPISSEVRAGRLPPDKFRTVLAALITVWTIGGWIDALGKTKMRGALGAQTKLWWIEQLVSIALAIVCIGVFMRKRAFLWPAFWLTVYSLVFDVVRWFFELYDREYLLPLALVLYALFLWRMWKTRNQVSAVEDGDIVEATG
jgi:hypothetical protein